MADTAHRHIGFLTKAEDFATAAEACIDRTGMLENYSLVGYYLMGHSIELALKSYLLRSRYTDKQLKRIGHDLRACLDTTIAAKIDPSLLLPNCDQCVDLLNDYYSRKELEYYSRPGLLTLPTRADLKQVVSHLLRGLKAQYVAELRTVPKQNVT